MNCAISIRPISFVFAASLPMFWGACGARAQFDSQAPAAGGSAGALPSSGGAAGNAGLSGQGGNALSTGGGSGFASLCGDLYNRLLDGCNAEFIIQIPEPSAANICDIPLASSPVDASMVAVVLDCSQVPTNQYAYEHDAGTTVGWAIDYGHTPAHLRLFGDSCNLLQVPENHQLVMFEMGYCPPLVAVFVR